MANIKNTKLTKIAEQERIRQIGHNERNSEKPYTKEEALKNVGGNKIDVAERIRQLGFNNYNSQKPYDLNNMD